MKIRKKNDNMFPKKIMDLLGFVTIVLAIGTFLTGKTDLKSFFANVTLSNFILTFGQTIIAYLLTPAIIISSLFIVFDFPLLLFGQHFIIAHFLWNYLFNEIVVTWWWDGSLAQNLFLSIILIYFISCYQIEYKNYTIAIFFIRVSKKWYNGLRVIVFKVENSNSPYILESGITIGLLLCKRNKHSLNDKNHL